MRKAVLDNVEFWLKKGVDGFRLDAINFCYHDAQLRDNPAKPKELRQGRGFSEDNPYAFQYHYYNNTQPENLSFMQEIRSLLDRYPGTVSLGEISSEDSLQTMAEYTADGDKLHMGYSFELLTKDYSAQYIRETVSTLESVMTQGWPCWAFSNHDVERVASRWNPTGNTDPKQVSMLTALLGSLRGSVCMYQGEELGLGEAQVAFEDLQDPYGITFWPNFKGRDGCRTPMPWQLEQPYAGFSTQAAWLPVEQQHQALAVDVQLQAEDSVLKRFQHFMAWRKTMPALQYGDIEFIDTPEPILAFYRHYEQQRILCIFNLSGEPQTLKLGDEIRSEHTELQHHNCTLDAGTLTMPSYGCYFAAL